MTYSKSAAQDKFDLPIILPVSIIHWTISDLDLFLEPSKALATPTQTEPDDPMLLSALGHAAALQPFLSSVEVLNGCNDDDPEVKPCRLPSWLLR